MKKETEKQSPSNLFEGMVSIRAVLQAQGTAYNSRRILRILYAQENIARRPREYRFLCTLAEKYRFPVALCTRAEIDSRALGTTHAGILAECSQRDLPCFTAPDRPDGFYMMLEGIEDPYNFGYALRSLYAAGVDGLIVPPRNWMTAAGVVCRASAGTSELLPMYTVSSVEDSIAVFRNAGYLIAAADVQNAENVYRTTLKKPLYLIVGGEKRGISAATLGQVDTIVRLVYGRDCAIALSAASAASILAFEVLRQNRDIHF